MKWVLIDEKKLKNEDMITLARLSGNNVMEAYASLLYIINVDKDIFDKALLRIEEELFKDGEEYILLKKDIFEDVVEDLEDKYREEFCNRVMGIDR